jgi:hypothetical protein
MDETPAIDLDQVEVGPGSSGGYRHQPIPFFEEEARR